MPPAVVEPVYRFVSLGVRGPIDQQALDRGRIGIITSGAPGREIVNADGSVEYATPGTSRLLMGAVPVPARLGGGFLFWDHALYWARSFNAPFEPIVDLPTNALGIEFGPDYVLLLLPDSPPRAFALDPPHALTLSPKGVIDVVATDDGRALALDAVGRALASTDAGKSWKDVTSLLPAPARGVRARGNEVAFASSGENSWLQSDGRFNLLPSSEKSAQKPAPGPSAFLHRAFSSGLAMSGQRAWVAGTRAPVVVDLRSGSASSATAIAPEGSTCFPASLEEEGLVVCTTYMSKPTTTVISHALSANPVVEKTFAGSFMFSRGRSLTVVAGCADNRAENAVCVRQSGGAWSELKLPAQMSKAWQVLAWVPRDYGGVVAIVGERDVPEEPKIGLLDPVTNHLTPWDTTYTQAMPNQSASPESSFIARADGSLLGFTRTGTIEVDPRGHATIGPRNFAAIYNAGPHALARDQDEHLWQTADYGAHWSEIARPPFDDAPEGAGPRGNQRPSERSTNIECSMLGCALDHSSGTGAWLRAGWPEDPPRAQPTSATPSPQEIARSMGRVVVDPPSMPVPVLPQLRCATRSGAALRVPKPAGTNASDQWLEALAGKRVLAQRGSRSFTNLTFRDVFSADKEYVSYGLRAALHFDAEPAQLAKLIGTKTALQALFVEPLEPSGRIRQFTTSTGPWQSFDVAGETGARRRRASEFDDRESVARPVLGSEPGHTGGVLLSGALSLFVSNKGQTEPIRQDCTASSGYVDAHGRRFVACAEQNASTHIEALDFPRNDLVRAAPAAHYRDRSPGLQFFAPGEPVFVNPDAIAVGRDGRLMLLRLPPGDEPPTVDNPAWLLSVNYEPLALAPWSTLEPATTAACAVGNGYRAIVQTGKPWFDVVGSSGSRNAGMTALVRWSAERVCLEAVEVGFGTVGDAESQYRVSAVARFVGAQPGAAFIGTEGAGMVREPATCELGTGTPAH